ncbi:MAG: hypothetical protein ABIX28_13430 [Vicinamibacterales bacterium]
MRCRILGILVPCALPLCLAACGSAPPTAPSSPPAPSTFSLEAEAGLGQGERMERTAASGGITIHLAPGERRQWRFTTAGAPTEYVISVRYSNDELTDSEVLRATLDGIPVGAFRAQDTGDDGAGWNAFVSDRVGRAPLAAGVHTLDLESSGGDGCIEIDLVALVPAANDGQG